MSVKQTTIDNVNHPPHYTARDIYISCECGSSNHIECISVTRHFNFNLGNAIKYIWRADHKAKPIEDLKKAVWYLQDEIKQREKWAESQDVYADDICNGEGKDSWCFICQVSPNNMQQHKIWHERKGNCLPLNLQGCEFCFEGGIDEIHVMFCSKNPDNK